jgi:translation initiation factor IF-2
VKQLRVHELAKKYDKSNKEVIKILKEAGIEVSSHLSGLTEKDMKKADSVLYNNRKNENSKDKKGKNTHNKKKEYSQNKADNKGNAQNTNNINAEGNKKEEDLEEQEDINVIKIKEDITLKELAEKLGLNPTELIKKLFLKGQMFTINSVLDYATAEEIAIEYDYLVEKEEEIVETYGEKFNLEEIDKEEDLEERPPVITIMGHVDHGKTSLLDAIRKTAVAEGEAGGITQKIGAYQIEKSGKKITFIDTPGHEAFTEMRARGAKATDIAILVVAADDGVMPQTVEAISHAKEAEVPIIVAVNKIDKPGAEPMRVKQELTEHGLIPAEWGGDTEFVEVSAKQVLNLDELLEMILITAEILELKANSNKRAKGVVLESRLDPAMGPVADILIQEGTLKVGDPFVVGETYGKVRAMIDDKGKKRKKASLAQPVEITGFNSVPGAGDVLYAIRNEKQSKKIVDEIIKEKKIKELNKRKHITLDDLHQRLEEEKLKDLKLIIKADSKGSVEALKESLHKLSNEEVKVNIIHGTAGAVTEGDVKLAEASDAIIIAFGVRPTTKARFEAEKEDVEIRTYSVIYHITKDLEEAIKGMLTPLYKEVYQGRAEIRKIFKISKIGNIGGSFVIEGKIRKESKIRVLRNGIIVQEGELSSLKRYTNDASEVIAGQECGITIENYNDIKEGDIIEAYTMVEIAR